MRAILLSSFAVLAVSCSSTAPRRAPAIRSSAPGVVQEELGLPPSAPRWSTGQTLVQGFVGWTSFSEVSVDSDFGEIDGDRGDMDELPLIGGGGQMKLGGDRIDVGLEGLLSFGGRANAEAFVVGGGGAAVAIDVDLLVFDLFGGPFASLMLGDKLRLYGGAGPLLQFIEYDQSGDGFAEDGSGFGAGWYARTGIELALPSRVLVGIGTRWSDSSVDLGSDLGDLDVEGLEWLITVSRGL